MLLMMFHHIFTEARVMTRTWFDPVNCDYLWIDDLFNSREKLRRDLNCDQPRIGTSIVPGIWEQCGDSDNWCSKTCENEQSCVKGKKYPNPHGRALTGRTQSGSPKAFLGKVAIMPRVVRKKNSAISDSWLARCMGNVRTPLPPYLNDIFNIMDIMIMVLFFIIIFLHIVQVGIELVELPRDFTKEVFYVAPFTISSIYQARAKVMAVTSFLIWYKGFETMRLSSSIATLVFIIIGMLVKLGSFLFFLITALLGFASLEYFAYGGTKEASSTFVKALLRALSGSLMGDTDLVGESEADLIMSGTVSILFIMVMVLLLLNLLIAVMSEAYEEVQDIAAARWAYVARDVLVVIYTCTVVLAEQDAYLIERLNTLHCLQGDLLVNRWGITRWGIYKLRYN